MDVSAIITLARDLFYVDSSQMSDTKLLEYLNNTYHDIENEITQFVGEDYFWLTKYYDTVAYQQTYALPTSAPGTAGGFKKFKTISVRYNYSTNITTETITAGAGVATGTYNGTSILDNMCVGDVIQVTDNAAVLQNKYILSINPITNTFTVDSNWTNAVTTKTLTVLRGQWIKLQGTDISNMPDDITNYNTDISLGYQINTSQQNGMFRIVGNDIQIYPYSKTALKYGVKMEYYVDNIDLVVADLSASVNIPRQFHNVIAKGMGVSIMQARGLYQEKQSVEASYMKEKADLLKDLQDRDQTPISGFLPPLYNLQ